MSKAAKKTQAEKDAEMLAAPAFAWIIHSVGESHGIDFKRTPSEILDLYGHRGVANAVRRQLKIKRAKKQ